MTPATLAKYEVALRLATAYRDAFNAGDAAGILSLLHPDCLFDEAEPASGKIYTRKEDIQAYLVASFKAAPGAYLSVEEAYSLGWHCVMRWCLKRDDEKDLRGVYLFTIRDGLIFSKHTYIKTD